MPSRDDAVGLLESWVENSGLRVHMYSVEAAVRHYAEMNGADADLWGLAGLLHDLDWERYPDDHPNRGVAELEALGYPPEIIRAIRAHRPDFTGVEPETLLDRVLFACDELSGLVYACCLVRPNGIDDLTPKSVKKKLKDRTFAAGVNREEVQRGMELLEVDPTEHIQNVIDGMRARGKELGIRAVDRARARGG